jgi:serine-type D-Ala-D-Ala carboxypeptidase (penicillin-binding protein 5/6)
MRILLFLLLALPALGFAEVPSAPNIAAKSWVLLDYTSGQILASQNADDRAEPASLTKLMTAYLSFQALQQKTITPAQVIPVSDRAWKAQGSRMFIQPRMPVTVDELLRGMIVQSGNDACIALAEAISGSEDAFVQNMNREAQRLGLKNTHFVNATGLPDPQHYSTAADLATLTAALIRDFPDYYALYSIREYKYNNINQPNRNRLLWVDPTVDGVKTGHTETAGYCLVASAHRGTRRMVSVVLGTTSDSVRAIESQKLLNHGFQNYDTLRLYEKGQQLSLLKVWKGADDEVKAGFDRDLYLTVPKGDSDKVKADLVSQQPLLAPISRGQQVATMRVSVDGKQIAQIPVLALDAVAIAGPIGRAWDTLRLWFK